MKSILYAYALLSCLSFISAADNAEAFAAVIQKVADSAIMNPDPSDVIAAVVGTFPSSESTSLTLDPVAWGHYEGCEAR